MKKIIIVAALSICLYILLQLFVQNGRNLNLNSQTTFSILSPSPLPTSIMKTSTVLWNDIIYAYAYFEVGDVTKLTLIANFTQKRRSEFLVTENDCQYAVNGGYYDTNNKPLGLFINPLLQTPAIGSTLVNGYVAIATKPTITYDLPDNPTLAVQAGPMLLVDGIKLKLAIKNDEYARRMIAGMSSKGTLVFLTTFIPETKVQGPKLADLPHILEQINKQLPNPIISAINLDGGNASMFKNKDISIPEISSVGSMFCVRE